MCAYWSMCADLNEYDIYNVFVFPPEFMSVTFVLIV